MARMKNETLLEDMLFEFISEVEENPFSLSSMKWYAFGWLLFVSIKIRMFFNDIRRRRARV